MFQENPALAALFMIFALSAAVQLFYYLWFYLPVVVYKHPEKEGTLEPVSVIICARNEAENLRDFLPAVCEQDYPDFEVIVVNDCSDDDSFDILGEYLLKYPNLKVSNVNKDPKFTHNKKFAQFIGIKAAKNDLLLFTDADCRPETPRWISMMASHFREGTDFVIGYGGYIAGEGLLNKYIRYEGMMVAVQYLGMAIKGLPYMGVGRNLAYRRSLFFGRKGFGSHNHVISGDDDLFVNSNATAGNTCVEFRRESHTRSMSARSFGEWFIQKKRHLTTAPYYKPVDKFLLITEPVSRLIFYSLFVLLLSFLFLWPFLLAVFGLRLITQLTILILAKKTLNEKGITGYSLIFDIFSPLINGVVLASNTIRRPGKNQWK
ncbi:MAG: glycosyltransferase [Bacteroidales bacterium]|nr:glycosyltransferase [Bacteroidales bacterium]